MLYVANTNSNNKCFIVKVSFFIFLTVERITMFMKLYWTSAPYAPVRCSCTVSLLLAEWAHRSGWSDRRQWREDHGRVGGNTEGERSKDSGYTAGDGEAEQDLSRSFKTEGYMLDGAIKYTLISWVLQTCSKDIDVGASNICRCPSVSWRIRSWWDPRELLKQGCWPMFLSIVVMVYHQ